MMIKWIVHEKWISCFFEHEMLKNDSLIYLNGIFFFSIQWE